MSLADKLDRVLTRAEEIRHLLATAEGTQFGALSKELSDLEPLVEKVGALRAAVRAEMEGRPEAASDAQAAEAAEAAGRLQLAAARVRLGERPIGFSLSLSSPQGALVALLGIRTYKHIHIHMRMFNSK